MVDISTISVVLAGISLTIASSYYTLTLRTANRTRQSQLFMQLYAYMTTPEAMKNWIDLLNMEWKDYDDFEKKYSSDNNPEAFAKRYAMWYWYDGVGVLLKEKLLDMDMVYLTAGWGVIWQWTKWESIIKEQRERYTGQDSLKGFEYLATEMAKIRRQRGITKEVPKTFARYIKE